MMDIYYVNSMGVRLNLLASPYMLQTADIFNYRWAYANRTTALKRNKISGFYKNIEEKQLLLSIVNFGKGAYYKAINHFVETTEIDILNRIPGELHVGDLYLKCYVIASEKTEWEDDIELMDNTITITTDYPFWIREHPYSFYASNITSTNNKRYANKYAYRYANGLNSTSIVNEHYAESNFRLNIYGACVKPSVYIGGYEYHIDIILEEGEYLEVDSAAETVTKIMTSGIRINAFNNRSFKNSVFRPIQTGKQDVFWDGKFDFDLTLYEERSEPKWS